MENSGKKRFVTLFLVAKFPQLESSKSRLASDGLGSTSALRFAQLCILDIIDTLGSNALENALKHELRTLDGTGQADVCIRRVILTSKNQDLLEFKSWIENSSEYGSKWKLENMNGNESIESSSGNLSTALGIAFSRRREAGDTAVAFIGMDTPQLTMHDVVASLALASSNSPHDICECKSRCCTLRSCQASITAAYDGGYVLLSLPCALRDPLRAFKGVAWSTGAAFATQVRAIISSGADIIIADNIYTDVDDMESFNALKEYYCNVTKEPSRLKSYFQEFGKGL